MRLAVPDHVLALPRKDVAEFSLGFARFEFALKASGFARNGQWGAEVDWSRFARSVGPRFDPSTRPELKIAVDYLLGDPPKKQRFVEGKLQWVPPVPPQAWPSMAKLLFHVRGVRNNLFHGAKFLQRESEDRARDAKLVSAASLVLAECLRLSPDIGRVFDTEVL